MKKIEMRSSRFKSNLFNWFVTKNWILMPDGNLNDSLSLSED